MQSNSYKSRVNSHLVVTIIFLCVVLCSGATYLLHWLGISLGLATVTTYGSALFILLNVHKIHWNKQERKINHQRQLLQRTSSALASNIGR